MNFQIRSPGDIRFYQILVTRNPRNPSLCTEVELQRFGRPMIGSGSAAWPSPELGGTATVHRVPTRRAVKIGAASPGAACPVAPIARGQPDCGVASDRSQYLTTVEALNSGSAPNMR